MISDSLVPPQSMAAHRRGSIRRISALRSLYLMMSIDGHSFSMKLKVLTHMVDGSYFWFLGQTLSVHFGAVLFCEETLFGDFVKISSSSVFLLFLLELDFCGDIILSIGEASPISISTRLDSIFVEILSYQSGRPPQSRSQDQSGRPPRS